MSETGTVTISIFQSIVLLPFARLGADSRDQRPLIFSRSELELALVLFDCFRDDTGDLLRGLETGGKPVLRQGPRDACCGVSACEASADASDPEHAPCLLRVCSQATDGVTQRPGDREAHDLVHAGERDRKSVV